MHTPRSYRRSALVTAGACCLLLGLSGCKKSSGPGTTNATQPAQSELKPSEDQAKEAKEQAKPEQAEQKPSAMPPIFSGSHILVAYKGAMRAHPTISRTKDEAKKRAEELAKQVKGAPDTFADVAKKNSDGPSAGSGGSLGSWPKGRMIPAFDQAIEKMKVGEISDPVETPFGFHIIRRDSPPPVFAGSHILVAYKGAMRAHPEITRSKEEAQKKAKELAETLRKNPDSFAELAKKNSDGPSGRNGGKLGRWPKGSMVPAFDDAIEKMKVGEISDPVETPFGFHVILREDPATFEQ